MTQFSSRAEWLATLPQKRSASGALFFNEQQQLLVLEPKIQEYQKGWGLPGGMVDAGESPRQAAERETLEEIGLTLTVGRLLCLDYMPAHIDDATQDSYQMIFDGGVLSASQIAQIKLCDVEIASYHFMDADSALPLLKPSLIQRTRMALQARSNGVTYYLENGQII